MMYKTKQNKTICQPNSYRATLPLTTETKELSDCMCPHLTNLNRNNGSDMNAPYIVTDLSNISNQGYGSDQLNFDTSRISNISSNNVHSNSNGDEIISTTTTTTTTAATTTTATNTSPTDESRLRHSSMDRLMCLLNDLGNSTRTRSLSDGGQEEGNRIEGKNQHLGLL